MGMCLLFCTHKYSVMICYFSVSSTCKKKKSEIHTVPTSSAKTRHKWRCDSFCLVSVLPLIKMHLMYFVPLHDLFCITPLTATKQLTTKYASCYQEYPKSSVVHARNTRASFSLWLKSQSMFVFSLLLPTLKTQQQVRLYVSELQSGLHVCCTPLRIRTPCYPKTDLSKLSLQAESLFLSVIRTSPWVVRAAAVSVRPRLGWDKAA